jgi:hypothetical protein
MTPDERLKAFIEILKIVIWPTALIWLVWYLRDEVKRAASRIIEVGFTGAKFAPPTEQVPSLPMSGVSATPSNLQSEAPAVSPAPVVEPSNLSRSNSSGLQNFISNITSFISKDQIDPGFETTRRELPKLVGPDPNDQIVALCYLAASLNVQVAHERNYNVIFGSQLQLLARANSGGGVPLNAAKAMYEAAKSGNPEVYLTFTFEQWMGFLQGAGLIEIAPSGNYILTSFGRGFLKYILDRHLSVVKPY